MGTKEKESEMYLRNPHLPISLLSMGPHRLSRRELSSTPQKRASAGPCLELFFSVFSFREFPDLLRGALHHWQRLKDAEDRRGYLGNASGDFRLVHCGVPPRRGTAQHG